MKNIYVIVSKEEYILNQKSSSLVKDLGIDLFNVCKYDFSLSDPNEIISELRTTSLFSDSKAIILTNPTFLKSDYKNEEAVNEFTKFFLEEDQQNFLIILTDTKPDLSLHINQVISSVGTIYDNLEIKQDDLASYIIDKAFEDGYTLDQETASELIARSDSDLMLIFNYLDKLETYKDDKAITYQDVCDVIPRHLEDNSFALLQAYIEKDTKQVLQIYNDFMISGDDELRIIYSLFTKLQEIYYTKCFVKKGFDKEMIATKFNCKPGKAYYMIKDSKNLSDSELIRIYKRLIDLDYDIKTNRVDKKVGLEMFFLGV